MINLADKAQRGRLLEAVKKSREAMVPFRKVRRELLNDYVGSWYSDPGGARYQTLVNLLNQTAKIYTVALAANNPQVTVSTAIPENWAFAKRFEVNLNKLISDMNLSKTFRAIVMDAFFCIGAAVVMMRDSDTRFHALLESEEDVWMDPGEPWLNRVSMDDLILDMSAREIPKMRFCGHEYRADFNKAKKEPGYSRAVREKLTPSKRSTGDNPESAREISSDASAEDDLLKPMIWFRDLWIPENGSVVTLARDQDLPPLIEREWTGNQDGPYKFLSLGFVPDNVIPSSPASNLKGLHDLQNRLHRKMQTQSDNQRTINAYSPHGVEDASKLRDAKDGDWVKVTNPRELQQVKLGGIDPGNQAFSMIVGEEYNKFAGNLAGRAGLGPQAGTATQEKIIQENIGEQDADMHLAVLAFATECCTDLGRLMWHDETIELTSSMAIEGTDLSVDSSWPVLNEWGERERQGEFEDLDLIVEAYSMPYKSPEQKVQEILGSIQELAPFWPMFEAAGYALDPTELLRLIADLRGRPELLRVITSATQPSGDRHGATQSPVTRRETVRRNVSTGGTADNRGAILAQVLGGGNAQVNNAQMGQLAGAGR